MNSNYRFAVGAALLLIVVFLSIAGLADQARPCIDCRKDLGCGSGFDKCAEVKCDNGLWYSCIGKPVPPR